MASNHVNVQRLTADKLSSIPRRNNILFLSDYLQEQHSYATGYASQGLVSWNHMASPAPKTTLAETSIALDDFLLGTPVLKARAPAAPAIERSSTVLKALDSAGGPVPENQASRKRTTRSRSRTTEKLPGLNHVNVASAEDNSTGGNVDTTKSFGRKEKPKEYKKRTEDERGDSDEERLKRLQERRERKRLKKSIMKSPSKASESEKENPAQSIKKKGYKKDKTKSPSFALMHGFTATNVRKSRITLGPLFRNVGVFKKGRASSTSKTGKLTTKKRNDHDVCFSEARFLGTARAKAIKNIDRSSSPPSSSSGGIHKKEVAVERKEKSNVSKKHKRPEELPEDLNCSNIFDRKKSTASSEDRRTYDPANSISWDIERESYIEESEAGCHQGTIILSFPRDAVACEKGQDANAETPAVRADTSPGNPDATFIKTSDDSLYPSQSASQVLRGQPNAQGIGKHEQPTFSKYFVPEDITTKEAGGLERQDSYEGRLSITLPERCREKNPNRSMFRQPPPRIEAHLASPTVSQISLNLVDELPRPYNDFALADVRSIFEYAAMELDGYGVFHGSDAALEEPDFRSRSDGEHNIAFEPGLNSIQQCMLEYPDSDNVMKQDLDYEDPPVEDLLPDECCHQNLHMGPGFIHEGSDRAALSNWNFDHGLFNIDDMPYKPGLGNDKFSGDVPNLSMPSVNGSSEDDNFCVDLPLDRFSQGRSLLYGLDHGHTRVSDAEAEVAKLLKQNHWLPHRL